MIAFRKSFKHIQLIKREFSKIMEAKKPKIEVAPNTIGTHSGTFHW